METAVKGRDQSVDLLKILSCFAVVGLHTFHKDLSLFNSTLYFLCGFAIPVFWMSSGAFLLNRPESTWRYLLKKILGILILVIIWNLIVSCGNIVGHMIFKPDPSLTFLSVPKAILGSLVQKGPMFHFWYFGALMIVYLLLPALQKAYRRNYKVLLFIFGLICLGFQICSFVIGQPVQKYIMQTFRLWTWLFYFILGGVIYKCLKFRSLTNYVGPTRLAIMLTIVTALIAVYQNIVGRYIIKELTGVLRAEFFYDSIFTMIWTSSMFVFICEAQLSERVKKVVTVMAPLTMGIYIIHPLFIRLVGHFMGPVTIGGSVLLFLTVLLCSTVAVECIYRIPILRDLIRL